MTACVAPQSRSTPRRGAFSIVEAVMSLVLVSGVMVAALNTVGASFTAQRGIGDRARGQLLANDLMSEILAQTYEDPIEGVTFGLEALELVGTNRSAYDDVDDYRNLTDSPPKLKNGTAIVGFTGWTRTVSVVRVDKDVLNCGSGTFPLCPVSESGVKKITVTVKHGNIVVATLVAIKTKASPAAGETPWHIDPIAIE